MTLKDDALVALTKSDITLLRALETGTQIPQEWVDYRNALRGIISGINKATSLPTNPSYPLVATSILGSEND